MRNQTEPILSYFAAGAFFSLVVFMSAGPSPPHSELSALDRLSLQILAIPLALIFFPARASFSAFKCPYETFLSLIYRLRHANS